MKNYLIIIITALTTTIFTSLLILHNINKESESIVGSGVEEAVYDRVLRTGKIRCGYVISHPALFQDANSGELSGISYEVMNKIGEILELKVEWVEEVGWGTLFSGFDSGRYDVLCSAIWSIPERARKGEFLDPLWYGAVHAWARPNDPRFKDGLKNINWDEIKISTMDGHISANVARNHFPNVQTVSVPDLSLISDVFLMVANEKADITFEQHYVGADFLEKNPGTLENITKGNPIKAYPTTIILPAGEYRLKTLLNTAQTELFNSGVIDTLIDKYAKYPNDLLRVQKRYQEGSE